MGGRGGANRTSGLRRYRTRIDEGESAYRGSITDRPAVFREKYRCGSSSDDLFRGNAQWSIFWHGFCGPFRRLSIQIPYRWLASASDRTGSDQPVAVPAVRRCSASLGARKDPLSAIYSGYDHAPKLLLPPAVHDPETLFLPSTACKSWRSPSRPRCSWWRCLPQGSWPAPAAACRMWQVVGSRAGTPGDSPTRIVPAG